MVDIPKRELTELPPEPPPVKTFLIGHAAGEMVAIPIEEARGVGPVGRITRVPGAPDSIAGLIYFRGGVEAAIDLGMVWFGKPSVVTSKARSILVEAEGMRGVFIIEELPDLLDSDPDSIEYDSESGLAGAIGYIEKGDEKIRLLSSGTLLRGLGGSII